MMKEEVDAFVREMREAGLPLHSVTVIQDGEVVNERYFAPFNKETLHRMYSVTKSFVSVAVGFLCEEGKLKLSDPILKYFPEYDRPQVSRQLRALTIEDMLKMQTCYLQTTYKSNPKKPWLPSFFTAAPHHEPGMIFMYDTSSTHTLCAMVEKLAGCDLMTYLREKFLDEIGFSKEAYILKNEFGETVAGGGMMARPDDMVKFAKLLMNDGRYNGKQLLPFEYMKKATSLQAGNNFKGEIKEEQQGYGYQFWRLTHNGFGCYGKGGQLILCYPDYEIAVVTTADVTGIQGANQLIYSSIYRNILDVREPKSRGTHAFGSSPCPEPAGEALLNEEKYICRENPYWKWMSFSAEHIVFGSDNGEYELKLGMAAWMEDRAGTFPLYGGPCIAKARWIDNKSIYVRIQCLEENLACVSLQASFKDGKMTCCMKNTHDFGYEEFSGWYEGERI